MLSSIFSHAHTHKEHIISWFQTFAVIWISYIFFWVFPRRQIIVGRRFRTLYQFHLQRLGVQCTGSHCTPSLWRWNWYRVPKRRPTYNLTQKKIYDTHFLIFHTFGPTGSSPYFSSNTFQNLPCISDLPSEVSKFQHHTKLFSKCRTSHNLSPICWWKKPFWLNPAFVMAILDSISRENLASFVIMLTK